MWYAGKSEPKDPDALVVPLADVKLRLSVDYSDDDDMLTDIVREATAYVESYCNIRLAPQTLTSECDGFRDLRRLPDGPVFADAVKEIGYVDQSGNPQTVDTGIYSLLLDGLEASIALKAGRVWPIPRHGERITVRIEAGYGDKLPYEIRAAIMVRVASVYRGRENAPMGEWSDFDSLLINFRRGA
ncbi:phage gp6-like head-tail connector protein [Agrobacterium genomosp. 3 str. CIP 111-78]|uniref:Phage gp6-like head-tail connector protein n=1 Tax=Agrobacterium tumefaciens TaxID=358 RepID=A0AAE6EM19_AGRTU|nr:MULTISPECIES: head-tail connector protein [Agrobacterium tumefaciens complex]MCA2372208.1 phage gp6-like head-tail connector protein [Agrobacterium tomkonis CIP 111-78]QCM02044.1 phage gp6-like head-tail connector protein [Agrobacterium tumefaciens]